MKLVHYILKYFSFFSIFFIVYLKSENTKEFKLQNIEYLVNICKMLKTELPKTENACKSLCGMLEGRYSKAFIESIEMKVKDWYEMNDTRCEDYWYFYFMCLAQETNDMESLLTNAKLDKIPLNKEDWAKVKNFITPLQENIYDLRIAFKEKILSLIDDRTLNSESDYLNRFIELSCYYTLIPSSKDAGILEYFGYREPPSNLMEVVRNIADKFMTLKKKAASPEKLARLKSLLQEEPKSQDFFAEP